MWLEMSYPAEDLYWKGRSQQVPDTQYTILSESTCLTPVMQVNDSKGRIEGHLEQWLSGQKSMYQGGRPTNRQLGSFYF